MHAKQVLYQPNHSLPICLTAPHPMHCGVVLSLNRLGLQLWEARTGRATWNGRWLDGFEPWKPSLANLNKKGIHWPDTGDAQNRRANIQVLEEAEARVAVRFLAAIPTAGC